MESIWYLMIYYNTWPTYLKITSFLFFVSHASTTVFVIRIGESLQRAAREFRLSLALLNICICKETSANKATAKRSLRALLRLVRTSRPRVRACGLMELSAGLTPVVFSVVAHYIIVVLQFMNLI
ncbi:hypothetical protein EVAR_81138_1 [Eumeta japonica]|uniref:Uncharacterized protein n=1 Tax=Eumeta variegata TaxID=151549 RepID=A0A4C1UJZ6_EUMVA|nr:hypothetical protein EVAR_81138_1 [Eumeta japonica]